MDISQREILEINQLKFIPLICYEIIYSGKINQGDNRVVKTNFTIDLQGYLVPKSINKELLKQSQKSFSRSSIVFNNELSLVKLDGPPLNSDRRDERVPQDRGEVRALADGLNVEQLIEGIGFMAIEDDFIIF